MIDAIIQLSDTQVCVRACVSMHMCVLAGVCVCVCSLTSKPHAQCPLGIDMD